MASSFRAQAAIESAAPTARPLIMRGQAAIESSSGSTARSQSKRGQAAMEYLVTYGWALLALFIVITFLVATGAFSSSAFSVQECVFQPDLPCSPFIMYKQDSLGGDVKLIFTLTNGMGFPIQVSNITYRAVNLGQSGATEYQGVPPEDIVPTGKPMAFAMRFTGSSGVSAREFKTIYATITFSNCKSGTCIGNYTTSGRISSVVEQLAGTAAAGEPAELG